MTKPRKKKLKVGDSFAEFKFTKDNKIILALNFEDADYKYTLTRNECKSLNETLSNVMIAFNDIDEAKSIISIISDAGSYLDSLHCSLDDAQDYLKNGNIHEAIDRILDMDSDIRDLSEAIENCRRI